MLGRIIKLIISVIIFVMDYSKRILFRVINRDLPGSCVVLYYHDVVECCHSSFCEQLDNIMKYTKTIAITNDMQFNKDIHYTVVTFDDAFISAFHNAFPVLLKNSIPFTIFTPSGQLGRQPGWLDNISSNDAEERVMSGSQIIELNRNDLVTFASHGIDHRNLVELNDNDARKEIFQSKRDLEKLIGKNVDTFSFPYGGFNEKHVKWAREAGYEHVFTTLPQVVFEEMNEFVIGRIRVDPTDWRLEFRLKLLGAYRWLPLAFRLKKRLRDKWKQFFLLKINFYN